MKLLYQGVDVEKLAGPGQERGASRDLLLFVLTLPETEGLRLWNQILSDPPLRGLPIAVLLAHGQEAAKAFGLRKGAPNDLEGPSLAHVKRLLDRIEPERNPERVIEAGQWVIDPATYRVSRPGKIVKLTSLEFRLLYYLASHPNRLFTRDQLLSALWESADRPNARIVDVYVRRVRVKIEPDPKSPVHLKTRRGIGYVFDSVAL